MRPRAYRGSSCCQLSVMESGENVELVDSLVGRSVRNSSGRPSCASRRCPPDNGASFSIGYTAERVLSINQRVSYTMDLRAARTSGTDSGLCRSTFTIDVYPDVIP